MAPETQHEQEREPLQALEQKRAKKAWEQIKQVVEKSKENSKLGESYRSLVRKAPAMIKTNGLGQTVAFLLSKAKESESDAEALLYRHLEAWLGDDEAPVPWPDELKAKGLIEKITLVDSGIYRQAAREALIYLGWLKRFAEARLEKG